jgi:hypothetical protein
MELSGLSRQADIWKLLSLAWVMGWWTLQNSIRLVPMIDQAGELVLSVCYITRPKWHIFQMIYAVHTAKSKFTVHQSQWLASWRHQFGRRRLLASELHCSFLSNPTSAIGNPCAYKSLMVRLPKYSRIVFGTLILRECIPPNHCIKSLISVEWPLFMFLRSGL